MPRPRISPHQAYVIFNNIDPSAMVAAVTEAAACNGATIPNPYAKSGARGGNLSKLPAAASLQSYDALAAAIARLTAERGTRVLLLASKGFLSGIEEAPRQQDLIDALRSSIVINGLDAKGLCNSALNSTISELASATGGLFFHNNNDLAAGFDQLGAVPDTSYLMAFHPYPQDAAGKYHKLKVRLAADALTDFPVQLAGRMAKTDKGEPLLSLIIHVDLARLQFAERDGRYLQKLQFIGALVNDHGEMVSAKEGLMDLALTEETITRLTASGVNATLGLSAPPGPYRVRVVVQESTAGWPR